MHDAFSSGPGTPKTGRIIPFARLKVPRISGDSEQMLVTYQKISVKQ